MKIGILTFHRSINNGAVLQCYSLLKRIQKDFPNIDVEVIDYQMKKIDSLYDGSFFHHLKQGNIKSKIVFLREMLKHKNKLKDEKIKYNVFRDSVDSNIKLSSFHCISDEYDELVCYINKNIDILVVGSDAIWNFQVRGYPNPYLPGLDIKCIKLSYAASCYGMDFDNFVSNNKNQLRESLTDFKYIGVRDYPTECFVKKIDPALELHHNCDPTCFLDVNELPIDVTQLKNKMISKGFSFTRESIGIMSANSEKACKMLRRMYGEQYQIVGLYNYVPGADVQLFDLNPFEWAYVFRFLKLTFTTYFHGTYLSLKNGVPVLCIALDTDFSKKYDTKVYDLLKRIDFTDSYFHTDFVCENFDNIKLRCDELLNKDYKNTIYNELNIESKNYESFKKILAQCIRKS